MEPIFIIFVAIVLIIILLVIGYRDILIVEENLNYFSDYFQTYEEMIDERLQLLESRIERLERGLCESCYDQFTKNMEEALKDI